MRTKRCKLYGEIFLGHYKECLIFEGVVSRENEFSDFAATLAKAVQQQFETDIDEQMPGEDTFSGYLNISFSKNFCI